MVVKLLVSRFTRNKVDKLGLQSEFEHYEKWLKEMVLEDNLKKEQKHRILSKEWHEDYKNVEPNYLVVRCRVFKRKTSIVIKVVND